MKVLQEGLGSFRNVTLDNTQLFYSELYGNSDYPMRRYQANSRFVRGFPRYVFEPLGIILIVLIALYLKAEGRDKDLIPLLGTIALGAQGYYHLYNKHLVPGAELGKFFICC